MKVNRVSFTGIKVYPKDNKDVKYLYNELLDVVREQRLPATFRTDVVELPASNKVAEILKKLNIKFKET